MKSIIEHLFLCVVPAVFLYLGYTQGDPAALVLGFVTGFAVAFSMLIDHSPIKKG